jgi:thiosulfate dehydrogenase [quinone] large subunit
MQQRAARGLLAAIQAIVGWEWLMSGGNKVLSGTFPQGLASAMSEGLKDNPNDWYVSFLQRVIVPNSAFFGYLIQWSECFVGVILLVGACLLLTSVRKPGEAQHGLFMAYESAVIVAALIGVLQVVNFHFYVGGWVIPTFNPAKPFDEGIDLEGLMPLFFLVIIIANTLLVREIRREAKHPMAQIAAS